MIIIARLPICFDSSSSMAQSLDKLSAISIESSSEMRSDDGHQDIILKDAKMNLELNY